MKNLNLLVWLTQLGLSVALPPLGFILLAAWLKNRWNWGGWVIWVGVILGLIVAVNSLVASLKAMNLMTKDKKEEIPPVSFNDHD